MRIVNLGSFLAISVLAVSGCMTSAPEPVGDQEGALVASRSASYDKCGDFGMGLVPWPRSEPFTYGELVEFATKIARQKGWDGVRAGKFVYDRHKPSERGILVSPFTVETLERSGVKVGEADWLIVFADK